MVLGVLPSIRCTHCLPCTPELTDTVTLFRLTVKSEGHSSKQHLDPAHYRRRDAQVRHVVEDWPAMHQSPAHMVVTHFILSDQQITDGSLV